MKVLILILSIVISLYAKSNDTCYTVQLISTYNSEKNMQLLHNNRYPESCKQMLIGDSLTVRCGCDDDFLKAKSSLSFYKNRYENAVLATTYKYRFDTDKLQDNSLLNIQKTKVDEAVQRESIQEKLPVASKKENSRQEVCYTIQLASTPTSKRNLETLMQEEYPSECMLMEIGSSLTIRCACYDTYVDAKNSLVNIQDTYSNAVIARTYKYRFEQDKIQNTNQLKKDSSKVKIDSKKLYKAVQDDEELKLILQVYLYKTDLENAYKVASLGYKRNPNSYYWNEQMAQISKWTNRSARSMKHFKNMYKLRYDKDLEEELIQYGILAYQYEEIEPLVVSRAQKFPTEENIDEMISVYKKIGSPEKVIKVLEGQYYKDSQNTMYLTKALDLSLDLGDLDLAKKYVELLEKTKPYKKVDANLIAKFYYVQQDIESAYSSLLSIDTNSTATQEDKIVYYKLESDLGWYLQDNYNAAIASKHLMDLNEARLADYERISFVFQKSDPKLAASAIKKAYEEYKLSYLFYSYANEAINQQSYDDLNSLVATIDEYDSALSKESLFWIIKSQLYAHYQDKELEKAALLKALEIEPDNYQIKLTLLWYFMDARDDVALRSVLTEMAEDNELDSSFYYPMASAYFYLSDINRASYYTQELMQLQSPITNLVEFQFLQAYIFQIQNNEGAFHTTMKSIVKSLKEKEEKDIQLKTQDEHLSNYLRASIYVHNPKKFEKRLKKSKPYLSKKNYDEIAYSWALKNGAQEKSLKIFNQMNAPDLWVKFSHSVNFQEHEKIENILDLYLPTISMGDASQATEQDGQIALSQSFTFEGYQKNDANQNAYIHHRDLSKIRSDYIDIKPSYYNRKPLLQKSITINNKSYLSNAYYLDANFNYYKNKTLDKFRLLWVPDKIIEAGIGLNKVFDRGRISAHIDIYDSIETYYGVSLSAEYKPSTDLFVSAKVVTNDNALESTQLLLGGKRDTVSFDITWNFLNSSSINLLYEKNYYTSQDEVDLGDGDYARLSYIHQIRNGYPDLRIGAFLDYGIYDETRGSKGVIDRLQVEPFPVLPEDFYNVGINFSYGMANADDYTRAWRPYLEIYPYYNSQEGDYTFGLNLGYGGKIWHQDHLIFGASYSEALSGIGGKIFELFLDYHFMYTHP